jgi:malonyl CoA-acyl carrier protein transacylase
MEVLTKQFNVQITDFDYVMGHSVGEISAMMAALCIDPTDAVRLAVRFCEWFPPSLPLFHKCDVST